MDTNHNLQITSTQTLSFIFLAASGLIQVSCNDNSSTPIATTIPSPISTSATPVAAITPQGKFSEYTPEVINQYISVCKSGGMAETECSCFINKAKELYPLAELVRINNEASKAKKNPPKIEQILQTCSQEQLVLATSALNKKPTTESSGSTTDVEANSDFDDTSSTGFIHSSSGNVKGYTHKDETYGSPHTKSSGRVSGFGSSRSSSSA